MARKVSEIIAVMDAEQAAQTSLSGLNSPSQTAIYKLWKYIVAVAQVLLETIVDEKKTEIEEIVASAAPGSDYWVKKRVLEFQYDAINPQVLSLDETTMAVAYDPINTSKRIISRCSVKTSTKKTALVKVATGEPPAALSAPQLTALQNYLTAGGDGTYNGRGVGIGFAGVQLTAMSAASDKVFIKGVIYYDGQYASVISANVIAAIKNYFANIAFDGEFKILTLVDYIQNVAGVTDVLFEHVAIRANSIVFANKTYLIQSFTEILSSYPTYAGYIEEETTPGEDLASRLTFTAST